MCGRCGQALVSLEPHTCPPDFSNKLHTARQGSDSSSLVRTVQELMVLSENCPYHSVFLRNILSFTSKIIFFLKQWNYQYRMILYIYLSDNYLITANTCSSSSLGSQCVSFVAPPAGQRGVRSHQEVQVF